MINFEIKAMIDIKQGRTDLESCQSAIACSKLPVETLEQGQKYDQS